MDLAKLSLWLATLAKDHPFTFLDHAIRSGDSLAGLTRRQIETFTWRSEFTTGRFFEKDVGDRVKAALRRSRMGGEAAKEETIESDGLRIDFGRRMVTLQDEEVRVTYVEFEILGALARSPGRVLTRETLLEHVWGDSEYRDPRTVDVHIRHLREKLEGDPKQPEFLFTVRGVGYRFKE